MGTSFVAGRDFDEHDNLSAPKVAIVNEEFARKIFPGKNPSASRSGAKNGANQTGHAVPGGGAGQKHQVLRTPRGLPADCVRA